MTGDWYVQRAKKNELWSLIKRVGEHWGEEKDFLRDYAAEVFAQWENDLPFAIECFKDLAEQARWVNRNFLTEGKLNGLDENKKQ